MVWKHVLPRFPGQIPAFLMDFQPCCKQHHERKSKSLTFWGASWSTPAGISQRSPPREGPREGRPGGRGRSTGKCTNFPHPKSWICRARARKIENGIRSKSSFSGGLEWMAKNNNQVNKFRSGIPLLSPTIPMISPKISSSQFSMKPFSSASRKPWLERCTSGTPHSRPRHTAAPCTSHSQCEMRPAPNPVRKGCTARNGGAPPARAQAFRGSVSRDMDWNPFFTSCCFFDREIGNPASIFGVFPAIAATEQTVVKRTLGFYLKQNVIIILYQNAGSPTHKKCSVHGTYDDTISKLGGIIFFSF